jgi:DNA (cytosine-5)-methyltransferase 1
MPAYYNEHDRFAAAWLRTLISKGLIADGDVDERDIQDVAPAAFIKAYLDCEIFL